MLAKTLLGLHALLKLKMFEKVLARLVSRGRTVSAVKSTHHDTDLDSPGKDSWRFRTAGASEVVLAGRKRWALMRETEEHNVPLAEILERMDAVDIVLVEGYKGEEGIPRILVHRKDFENSAQMMPGIAAIATDDPDLEVPEGIAKLDINSPGAIANFVVTLKADSDHL